MVLPVFWLGIGLTVSAQTLGAESSDCSGATVVTAYVDEDAGSEPQDQTDGQDNTDSQAQPGGQDHTEELNKGTATGDETQRIIRLLLGCSGALLAAGAVLGRKAYKESGGIENNYDDNNGQEENED